MDDRERAISHSLMKFYTAESSIYLQNRPWMRSHILENMVKVVSRFLRFKVGCKERYMTVLNVGCGTGWLEGSLAFFDNRFMQNTQFVSLDIAVGMAKTVKKLSPWVEAVVADGEALPFRPGSFDAIVSSRAIKFMRPWRFLSGVKEVLSRDGFLLVIYDCGDALWVRFLERVGFPVDVGIDSRTLRTRELLSMLRNVGFDYLASFPVTSLSLSIFSYVPRRLGMFLKCLDVPKIIGARINVVCAKNGRALLPKSTLT